MSVGRRGARVAVRALVALGFASLPALAQYRHRIVLLEPRSGEPRPELAARLRGELAAAGFDVLTLPVDDTQSLPRAAESAAAELHPAAVVYVVLPPEESSETPGEVWVSDRLLRRTVVVRFRAEAGGPPGEAAKVAVQVVEILKADLAELSVTRDARAEPARSPTRPARAHAPPPKPAPEPPTARAELQAGLGLLQGFAGVRSTWTPVLRVGASLPGAWFGEAPLTLSVLARAAALGGTVRIDAAEGEARVAQALATLDLVARFGQGERLQPFVVVSNGAYSAHVEGAGAPSVHERRTWSAASGGGFGLWVELGPGFSLALSAEALLAWSRTVVRIAEQRVATAGAPVALVSASAVGSF